MTNSKTKMSDEEAFQALIRLHSKISLAAMCGITKQAVTRWRSVPIQYVNPIHKKTGIKREALRPSDFG